MENYNNIDDLIGKFLAGEANPEEAIFLEEWKSADPKQQKYFEALSALYGSSEQTPISSQKMNDAWDTVKAELQFIPEKRIANKNIFYLGIAASIALVLVCTAIYFYLLRPTKALEYVAMNSDVSLKLEDQTEIEVFKHSSINLDQDFNGKSRRMRLKGSAYFSVVHDAEKPFIVSVGNLDVKDIGTKFKIVSSNNGDTISISVDEGEVFLYDSLGFEKRIRANEKYNYIVSEHLNSKIKGDNDDNVLRSFNFQNTSIEDLLAQLNAAYNVSITISDPQILDCKITAEFKQERLENVLLIICETLGFEFEKNGQGFILIGNKCKG